MSWLYSQALVAEYLEGTCSDGAPFAPSNGNHTTQAYLPPDKMTAFSRPSRFGMTFAHLTDDRGEELLTWFRAGFRARTSAPQALGLASTASDLASGEKWPGSLAKYDRASRSWRTRQFSLLGGLVEFSETWPKWGSMRGGVAYQQQRSERLTNGKGYGFALGLVRKPTHSVPTPTASDHIRRACTNGLFNPETNKAVNLNRFLGGIPNPDWSEWLMGWPIRWTDLRPLETDRCRSAQRRHGGF